jgi:hypothetical protein
MLERVGEAFLLLGQFDGVDALEQVMSNPYIVPGARVRCPYIENWQGTVKSVSGERVELHEHPAWWWIELLKPVVRVKAPTRMLGVGVPDDAQPGDLVVGNRGAASRVVQPPSQFGGLCACLTLEYVGNVYDNDIRVHLCNKVHNFSGGTRP